MAPRFVVLLALASLGCGVGLPAAPAHRSEGPARELQSLDQLAFLDGCWSYFHIDWGFSMTFHREDDAWVVEEVVSGPMAIPGSSTFRIEDRDGLVMSRRLAYVANSDAQHWTPVLAARSRRVVFEDDRGGLELALDGETDQLRVRDLPDGPLYELERCPARGSRGR